MVRNIIIGFCLTFISCMSIYEPPKNKCGKYRIQYRLKKVDKSFFKICDTSAVYKYDGEFTRDENDNLHYVRYEYNNYYKFYDNGKVGYFGIDDKHILSKKTMNPCNFLNGYYGCTKKGKYILKRGVVSKANGTFTSTSLFEFKGDTLEIIDESLVQRGYKKIFIKKQIPKDWLIYTPDW